MNHKEIIHFFLRKHLNPNDSKAIDMTAGNGHDTLFLARHSKQVLAIDIQKEAIEATKKRCQCFDNVTYLLADHSAFTLPKHEKIDVAMYNLGYLPGSDKNIITKPSSTVKSLKLIWPHIESALSISAYRGHAGGEEEFEAIVQFLNEQKTPYHLIAYDNPKAPVTFLIDLKNKQASHILVDELRHLPQKQAFEKLEATFQAR